MTRIFILALVALVGGAAGYAISGPQGPTTVPPHIETFVNPSVNGSGIDVRFAEHMQANPRYTATRFCMDHGYSEVTDYSVRAAGTTFTLGDQNHQRGALNEFSLIACGFASQFG